MFKNLRLGLKIGSGFGVVLLLLSIVLAIGVISLQKANNGITEYRNLAKETNLASSLESNMLMMRMSIKDYLIHEDQPSLQQSQKHLTKLKSVLDEAKQNIHQAERTSLVNAIEKSIVTYENAFDNVVQLVDKRDVIDEQNLIPNGKKMGVILDKIIESAYKDGDIQAAFYASRVQKAMLLGRLYVAKFLHTNLDADYKIAINNISASFNAKITQLDSQLQNPARRTLLKEFIGIHNTYVQGTKDIHTLIVARNNIVHSTLDIIGPQVAQSSEAIKSSIKKEQDTLGPELKANTENSVYLTLFLAVCALVLGIISAFLLTRIITRPIQKAVQAAHQLADGDLNVNVEITSQDETGELLNAVQNTATNLRKMISTISSASSELASASEELAVVTDQTAKSISQQETQTDLVATAMNQMTTSVHNVADNAARASEAATQADQEAITGAEIVQATITSINTLSESVNHSSFKLNEVQEEVVNISKILEVIREIAEQTNLLALNAAIEAARAGEQGRGFAVVADEVRSLAERTQGSTTEIQTIIEQLRNGTQSAVAAMVQGKDQADNCVEQAQKTGAALEAITSAIAVIDDMNMQIASASEQQSTVAEEINQNVLNVKQIAEENSVASNQTRSSSSEIASLATDLGQLVAQFRI